MRKRLAACLFPFLFVASVVAFLAVATAFQPDGNSFPSESAMALLTLVALVFSGVSVYLLVWRFGTQLAFYWCFWSGLGMLSCALFAIWPESQFSEIVDPYNTMAFLRISGLLTVMVEILFGISLMVSALIQDLPVSRKALSLNKQV